MLIKLPQPKKTLLRKYFPDILTLALITSTINYSGAWVCPDECKFIKLHTIKLNGKQQTPHIVVQMNAVNTIKAAANTKGPDLYNEIVYLEPFSKEFKYHTKCYNSFTYGYSSSMRNREKEPADDDCLQPNSKSAWEAVKTLINEQVLHEKKAISMYFLHGLYKLNPSDTRYRNKLKTRICNEFSESLTFLTPANNQAGVVISTSVLSGKRHLSGDSILRNAAYHLRQDILNFANQLPEPKWLPTPDELTSDERNPPKSVTDFLAYLLKPEKHKLSGNVHRLIGSYAADMVYGVTKGKTIPAKHFLLALCLHNITGKKWWLKLIINWVIA